MDETSGQPLVKIRGRGTAWNPPNRFEHIEFVPDLDEIGGEDEPRPRTTFMRDASKSIISRNDSPDIPFTASVNPYRGCEHGCLYSRFRRLTNLRVPSLNSAGTCADFRGNKQFHDSGFTLPWNSFTTRSGLGTRTG